ncbi:DNA primase large subunit isoform X3 [Ambystoma mexicanum]|uniref:DNA primase large subunit isoform X3 n=1 Tax=Ambystoma mexicanum TaxID=8296 RepID=UPI0037E809F4
MKNPDICIRPCRRNFKMQFSKDRKKKLYTKLSGDRRAELYTHSLQFYQEPPSENISLAEFETFAIERLKLLKSVENLGVSYVKTNDQYKAKLESELRKLKFPYRPVNEAIKDDEYDQRRKDHISHFILRLAYCQSEDLRRWFIQQEMDLFRYRFSVLTKGAIQEFLNHNKLKYDAISVEEKESYKEKLRLSTPGLSTTKIDEQEFYKVPFQDALDLVRPRKVFLRKGFAYIPHQEIITIVLNDFRTKLSKALAVHHALLHVSRVPDTGGWFF